ncbi:MAG: helix-turn-helix domain-containing protein [Candidatus Marinimicrobia bacterium]|nr:helix-turn-helix domain-containing protein [Candidatus Neomarinimicrobiota bacterium]MCF7880549.1 helix-turn-helix domain-containing protein [Candidatus Neomarinimicrobiota bacterium]
MDNEILDIEAAAEFLGIKKRTMYKLVKDGEIPAAKIGGQWRFYREQLLELFKAPKSEADNFPSDKHK